MYDFSDNIEDVYLYGHILIVEKLNNYNFFLLIL